MSTALRERLRLSSGTEVSFITAGEPSKPPVLLLHGFPTSARMFRHLVPMLAREAHVVAPDLPGFGGSDPLPEPSFPALGEAMSELLDRLAIGPRHLYLHDFGAPVGLHLAMRAPETVLGLIVQNANAHPEGLGPPWAATQAYWAYPSPENEQAATAHLTFEGTRDQYLAGLPADLAARIPAEVWEEDWRVMSQPGRLAMHRALVADYGRYVARFGAIADYLARWQPPSLLLWGRHDAFFALDEVTAWLHALPRLEAHLFDAGHFLLETHAAAVAALIVDFIGRVATGTPGMARPAC